MLMHQSQPAEQTISYLSLSDDIRGEANGYDFAILITGDDGLIQWQDALSHVVVSLSFGISLWIQGVPEKLAEIGVYLDDTLRFRYWIAIESVLREGTASPSVHGAVAVFMKGEAFDIREVRIPHKASHACS